MASVVAIDLDFHAGASARVGHGAGPALQPIREILLLICCRCSNARSLAQFKIALGAARGLLFARRSRRWEPSRRQPLLRPIIARQLN
jgi:hypothetical protein